MKDNKMEAKKGRNIKELLAEFYDHIESDPDFNYREEDFIEWLNDYELI